MAHIVLFKTNSTTENIYVINNLDFLTIGVGTPVSPMPLPEEDDEENVLVKIEGNTQKIEVAWNIVEEQSNVKGSDLGSYGGSGRKNWKYESNKWSLRNPDTSSLTALEQISFLRDFAPVSVKDSYELGIFEDGKTETESSYVRLGTISDITFSIAGDSPVVWKAKVSFYVGNVVSAFESDIPEAPSISSVTSGSSGAYTVTWKEFDGYASGEEPTLTKVSIRHKKQAGGSWSEETRTTDGSLDSGTLNNGTETITGLESGKTYYVEVAHQNAASFLYSKKWSTRETVTIA